MCYVAPLFEWWKVWRDMFNTDITGRKVCYNLRERRNSFTSSCCSCIKVNKRFTRKRFIRFECACLLKTKSKKLELKLVKQKKVYLWTCVSSLLLKDKSVNNKLKTKTTWPSCSKKNLEKKNQKSFIRKSIWNSTHLECKYLKYI